MIIVKNGISKDVTKEVYLAKFKALGFKIEKTSKHNKKSKNETEDESEEIEEKSEETEE